MASAEEGEAEYQYDGTSTEEYATEDEYENEDEDGGGADCDVEGGCSCGKTDGAGDFDDDDDDDDEVICRICYEEAPPTQTLQEITALMAKFREIQEQVHAASGRRDDAEAVSSSTTTHARETTTEAANDEDERRSSVLRVPSISAIASTVTNRIVSVANFCRNIEPPSATADGSVRRTSPVSATTAGTAEPRAASVERADGVDCGDRVTPDADEDEGAESDGEGGADDQQNVDDCGSRAPGFSIDVGTDVHDHVYTQEERKRPELYDELLRGDVKVWSSLIQLDCTCKGKLGIAHRACAFRWYLSRPEGTKCEICSSQVFSDASWENLVFLSLVQMAVNDRAARAGGGGAFRLQIGAPGASGPQIDAATLAMQQIRNARYATYAYLCVVWQFRACILNFVFFCRTRRGVGVTG